MNTQYTVKEFKPSDLASIKDIWTSLETGDEMTYFQGYSWNLLVARKLPEDTRAYRSVYFIVYDNEKPIMIAPLFLILHRVRFINKKGCYLLGRHGWSDYLNLIYKEFDRNGFEYLTRYIKEKYNISDYYLEQLPETSTTYSLLKDGSQEDNTTVCVKLEMPNTENEYNGKLSKHARQNLRTARNRLAKSNIEYTIKYDDADADKAVCMSLRDARLPAKKHITFVNHIIGIIKTFLSIKFPGYVPIDQYDEGKFLTIYNDKNELMAFFFYVHDISHSTILVLTAGTSIEYSWYSPGMVCMYDFILNHISQNDVRYIDFTRGDEPYKYALGGYDHYIHNIHVKL